MRNRHTRKGLALTAVLAAALALTACATPVETANPTPTATAQAAMATETAAQGEYRLITAEEAKTILDTQKDAILVDVREPSEYQVKHIANAKLLPLGDIATRAATELPDKDATILVYCRSGSRSRSAANQLVTLGYTGVLDMGGILNWPYEVVKE